MEEITSQRKSELDKYFHPVPQIVYKLPDPKSVSSFSEVWMKNQDGSYHVYKMVAGAWINTAKNLTE